MVATTNQKARLLDLTTGVLELVRDGKRDADEVCDVLQIIKEQRGFASILRRDQQVVPKLEVFKTIKLGTGLRTADDFRNALKDGGYRIDHLTDRILGSPAFTASETETEVDLVVRSVADLGFENGAKRSDIYIRAQELGLELCPPEVGPQLRLQYKGQPRGERLLIGTEPMSDQTGRLRVFSVEHGKNGFWLGINRGVPGLVWRGDCRWVFLRRK